MNPRSHHREVAAAAAPVPGFCRTGGLSMSLGICLTVLIPAVSLAWSSDPAVDDPVCVADGHQSEPRIVPEGSSGLLAVWIDSRDDTGTLRVQRLDDDGVPLWDPEGVPVCTVPAVVTEHDLAPDGAGGVIVAWCDGRNGTQDVFAQRIDATGARLWGDAGLTVCDAERHQRRVAALADGSGGVTLVWDDMRRSSSVSDIYLQGLDADGVAHHASGGLVVAAANTIERHAALIDDGVGGVIVTWYRSDGAGLLAARLNAAGTHLWGGAIPVSGTLSSAAVPLIVPDAAGGAVVAWLLGPTLAAQRLSEDGDRLWGGGAPVPVTLSARGKDNPQMVSTAEGGAFLGWYEWAGTYRKTLAQRLSATGSRAWTDTALVIGEDAGNDAPGLVPGEDGRLLVSWRDGEFDVRGQKVAPGGTFEWDAGGVLISSGPGSGIRLVAAPTVAGGMLVSFERTGLGKDVMAKRVLASGDLGELLAAGEASGSAWTPPMHLLLAHPTPSRAGVAVELDLADAGLSVADVYDAMGRRVRRLATGPLGAGRHTLRWDGRDDAGRSMPAGVYHIRIDHVSGRFVARAILQP